MPGKINLVLYEAAAQVATQIMGSDIAVTFTGTNDAFELNVFIPVMTCNVLESAKLPTNTAHVFIEKLADDIESNTRCTRTLAESSPSTVTPLNSAVDYENAAKVVRTALKESKTVH